MVTLNEISQAKWQEEKAEHLRYEYDIKPDDICIDLGSYQREWADGMIKRYGCRVECFDALDNKAAGISNGKISMGGQYLYTSAFAPKPDKEYFCVDIAEYLNQEIAVMKMNVEGYEYVLLPYIIEKGLQKNIRNLQVQFHLIEGHKCENKYMSIHNELTKTHQLTWCYPFCWENWERC